VSTIYHRHRGGNHPHVHDHHGHYRDDRPDHHDHRGHRQNNRGHGHHAYDARGQQPAIVEGNSRELGHWHFDRPFEDIAIAPACELSEKHAAAVVPSVGSELSRRPWAPRSPPHPT